MQARNEQRLNAGHASGRSERSVGGPAGRKWVSAKPVGGFVPKLTKRAFEKYGFATAALATDWSAIVGEALARKCQPERLNWPRPNAQTAGAIDNRPGATLVLAVPQAFALEVQYQTTDIIGQVNTYLGYRAVAAVRLLQRPDGFGPRSSGGLGQMARQNLGGVGRSSEQSVAPLSEDVTHIAHPGVRAALDRLQKNISSSAG
ncbi:MAG: DciA family protein [Pseudomonadota bacterium]